MQSAIMIEQVYSRHKYTNYPDAYYDMCNGKAEFPKCNGLVKKPFIVGYPMVTPIVWVKENSCGYRNRTRRSPVQSKSIQIEAFL